MADVLKGREAVDLYRSERANQHSTLTGKAIHDNTAILSTLVGTLDGLGYTSIYTDDKERNTDILSKFFADNYLYNVKELGFDDITDYEANHTETDAIALMEKWK